MNKDKDYYQILGIDVSADKSRVKSAYRLLARKYHPDANQGNKISEEKFKEIGEAYSILHDDNKRTKYDLLRGITQKQANTSEQAKKQASDAYSEKKKSGEEKRSFHGVFSEFVDKMFEKDSFNAESKKSESPEQAKTQPKKTEPQKPAAKKGEDLTLDIKITIVEAKNGTLRNVNILHTETCKSCKGKKNLGSIPCNACKGAGELSSHKKLSVKIPANISDGTKIRIANEGNQGENGGEKGDLFLVAHIIKNALFEFDNLNVLCEIPITPSEAALGADILIPSIEGHTSMKIPPETHSGQKFRLSGEGIPNAKTGKRGDQIVTIKIEIPPGLTQKEKELYRELEKISHFNPREGMIN